MKRILPILLAIIAGLVIASCESKPKGAEVVIANFLDKVKALELNKDSLSPYIYEYNNQLDVLDRLAQSPGFSESKMIFNLYFGNMTYKFLGQESTDDGVLVTAEIRNVGTASFTQRIINELFNKYIENDMSNMEKLNSASEEEKEQMQEQLKKESEDYLNTLIKGFKLQNSDFLTSEVVFLVKKDEFGEDKIVLSDKETVYKLLSALSPTPQEELLEENSENSISESDKAQDLITKDKKEDSEVSAIPPKN